MKRKTIYNYLVIILAWVLFLNKGELISFILLFFSSLFLFLTNKKMNVYRFFLTFIIFIFPLLFIVKIANLSIFYPLIKYYVIILSFNLASLNETQYLLNIDLLMSCFLLMMVVTVVFILIALILPEGLYTIFTKAHLYTLIAMIFLPYLFELGYLLSYKSITYKTI